MNYASPHDRIRQLETRLGEWVRITQAAGLAEDRLYLAAFAAFNFVKTFSLLTKHRGFSEEREWRVIYLPERDPLGYLSPSLDYFIGSHGVEPKLKYKLGSTLRPTNGKGDDLVTSSISNMLHLIILGPSISSPLSRLSFMRMLQRIKKPDISDLVVPSTIPLRPQG